VNRVRPVTRRVLARNSMLNIIYLSVPLVVAILVLPATIHGLGRERFGILALAWVVTGYFVFLDMGIGRATAKYTADALGRGRDDEISATVWTAVSAQAAIGLAAAAVLAAVAPLLVGEVLRVPPPLVGEGTRVFLLVALAVPPMILTASLRGVLEAAQRFELVNAVRLPASLATLLLPFAGVLLEWSLEAIVLGIVAAQVLALGANVALVARIFPSVRRFQFDRRRLRPLLSFGWWVTVPTIVGPLLAYLDRFVVGAAVSIAAVAYYAVPADLLARLWFIPASLITPLFPAVSRLRGAGDEAEIPRMVARSVKYLVLGMGPLLVLLAVNANDILLRWLGPGFAENATPILQIIAVGTFANFMAAVPFSAIQAMGRADLLAKLSLIEVVPYAVLLWGLVTGYGLVGAALAWTTRVTLEAVIVWGISIRVMNVPSRMFREERLPQAILLLALYLGIALLLATTVPGVVVRAFLLLVAAAAIGLGGWRHVMAERDRDRVVAAMRMAGPS
jgi:O-antigen/teichoic acid export membrane protein